MIIDLKRIFATEGLDLKINDALDMSEVEQFGYFPLKRPVCFNGTVSNKASIVSLNLEIVYVYDAPCDRCGVDTAKEHRITIDKILATSIEGKESDTIITVPDMKLDVDELVFSEVILDFPSKHLCKEECKGICSKCGKNLNDGGCNCPTKEIDPRLSKLAELLNNE